MAKIIRRTVIASVLVILTLLALSSCKKNDGVIEYKSVKGGYEVVGLLDKDVKDVKIPESFKGKSVIGIADGAFRGTGIESVTIPSTVKSFGLNAFEYCLSLKKVSVDAPYDFADAKFENVYSNPLNNGAALFVGESEVLELALDCESVGDYAYAGCASIESLTLSGTKSVGIGSFLNCCGLASVELGSALESIGVSAFSGNVSLVSIELPESLNSIGHSAFSSNSALVSVSLPSGVTAIPERAFWGCTALSGIELDSVVSIGGYAFYNCGSIEELTISKNIKTVSEYAFYNCGMRKITVAEDSALEYIGEAAFRGCSSLEEIHLDKADKLATIEKNAFEYCTSLVSLTLPSSLESLGDFAFAGCDSLEYNMFDGVGYIGNDKDKFILAHKLVKTDYDDVVINEKTKFIHSCAFLNAKSLTEIRIYGGVKSIGEQAFAFCTSLSEVTLPASLRIIGNRAFVGCVAFDRLNFMGSSDQWNKSENPNYVKKGTDWKYNAGKYTIIYSYIPNRG